MTIRRLPSLGLALVAALLTADRGRAQVMEPAAETPTFRDRAREFFGFDAGKRRAMREALVRSPDGTWCLETASGLQPHPCQKDYAAAENAFSQGRFATAAKAFKKLGERYQGSALQEDCLFYEAEAYYQDGHLPSATDTFHALMKEFPSTRHLTNAIQRVYKISEEWLEDSRLRSQGQPGKHQWWNRHVNMFDRRRPLLDTSGRAIEAIERIQQYDPTGPLTASATMMAGAEKFTSGDYVQAAGYYEQVVVDSPKSELAARAAVLSAQSYMRSYQGPSYDSEDLIKAQKMTEEGIKRAALLDPEQTTRLQDDLKKIHQLRAERLLADGKAFADLRKWTGARYCYEQVLKRYPESAVAAKAKDELVKIAHKLPPKQESAELKYGEESEWSLPKMNLPSWKTPSLLPKKESTKEPTKDSPPADDGDESVRLPPALKPGKLPDALRDDATQLPPAK
jgi:TolA-binding protein